MRRLLRRARERWRALGRSSALDAEMREEMRFHVAMEAERLAAAGRLDSGEARRQALLRFGGLARYEEEGRDARGFGWLSSAALDTRLALRLLARQRWLTLVATVAMAVAIAVGATAFESIRELLDPALPFPHGDRIVSVQYRSASGPIDPHALQAFEAWRDRLGTLDLTGAVRTTRHNLSVPGRAPESIDVAEITASAFDLAQTRPLLGRTLVGGDEHSSAAPVLVLGYDAWRLDLGGDPHAVGRVVQLGGIAHTVVGVMPDGFAFPFNDQYWVPLRLDPLASAPWDGPELQLFGRLAPGATPAQAEAEIASATPAPPAVRADASATRHPVVRPFTRSSIEADGPAFVATLRIVQGLVGLLAVVVAINLATLLYARTMTRLGELAVRTALGASRSRILWQLFLEALSLNSLGAAGGLVLSAAALRQIDSLAHAGGGFPFWIHFHLSPASTLYSLALAVLAAAIMGVVPGLKATGRSLSANLQELNGRTATRLGSLWTTLIVGQVAVAVAVLPVAAVIAWHVMNIEAERPASAPERLVVANMTLDDGSVAPDREAARQRLVTLIDRLREEPRVSAVTFSSAVPGLGPDHRIELEHPREGALADPEVASFRIDPGLLAAYGARLLAGRDFSPRDAADPAIAIVNRSFAERVLGGPVTAALGARFRDTVAGQWLEVVGVVEDFPRLPRAPGSEAEPSVYRTATAGDVYPAVVTLRFDGPAPPGFADRLRRIGAGIDPAVQLRRIVPLSDFYDELRLVWRRLAWAAAIITAMVLLLSAAGVHAMMSCTIAQRTREIGIRSALGASPAQLIRGVFGGVLRQLAIGVALGTLLAAAAWPATGVGLRLGAALLALVALVITAVAVLAALGPARRGLKLPTVDALRADG